MKSHQNKLILFISFVIIFLINYQVISQGEDASQYKMRFNFSTIKQHDNSRILELNFIGQNKKDRKDRIPVYEADISFYNILDDQEILLGNTKTSKEGRATLEIEENHQYLTDADGNINLLARFDGSDGLKKMSKEIIVKNLYLELLLAEIDSVQTAQVNAYTLDSLGAREAIDEVEIKFFIKGMLSNMLIEEGEISDGAYEFEMPTQIPGDLNGDFLVIAMIEDSDDFGNVLQQKSVDWGIFDDIVIKQKNTLWTEAAPLWMYVVLTILLVGVWANYIYTIVNLFKIKKESKDLSLSENE